jgi:hypothetical protein
VDKLLDSDGLEDTRRAEKASELDSIRTELITNKRSAKFNTEPIKAEISPTRFFRHPCSIVSSNSGEIDPGLSLLINDDQP